MGIRECLDLGRYESRYLSDVTDHPRATACLHIREPTHCKQLTRKVARNMVEKRSWSADGIPRNPLPPATTIRLEAMGAEFAPMRQW